MEIQLNHRQTCDPKKEELLIISILVAYDEKIFLLIVQQRMNN